MKTLKLEIPEGYEVESFDKETGIIKLKETPKDIRERIKTFDDVLNHLGLDKNDFEYRIEDMTKDEAAYVKVKLIAKALNEGWIPDWTDSSQYKYYPWFRMGSPSGFGFSVYADDCWLAYSSVGSRLCFKSRDLAIYAGKTFKNIYKEFLT